MRRFCCCLDGLEFTASVNVSVNRRTIAVGITLLRTWFARCDSEEIAISARQARLQLKGTVLERLRSGLARLHIDLAVHLLTSRYCGFGVGDVCQAVPTMNVTFGRLVLQQIVTFTGLALNIMFTNCDIC